MTSDALKFYKLTILYFLQKAGQPMTNAILSDFILGKGYTDYYSIQETFSDLLDDNMIQAEQTHNTTYYSLTPSGVQTLAFFGKQLPNKTKEEILFYLKKNKIEIVEEISLKTDYSKIKEHEYLASCSIHERGSTIFEVTINVPSEEEAASICRRFREKNEKIFSYVFRELSIDD